MSHSPNGQPTPPWFQEGALGILLSEEGRIVAQTKNVPALLGTTHPVVERTCVHLLGTARCEGCPIGRKIAARSGLLATRTLPDELTVTCEPLAGSVELWVHVLQPTRDSMLHVLATLDLARHREAETSFLVHELSNIMTAVAGNLELTWPRAAGKLQQELRELHHLSRTAVDLLIRFRRFHRITSPPSGARVSSLSEAVQDAVAACTYEVRRTETSVSLALPEKPVLVAMEPTALRQVLINIFMNAVQAASSGRKTPEVAISAGTEGPRAVVTCRDNGPGIPDRDLARIFELYYTTKPQGTGLGLSLAKALVEGVGGEIQVETGPDGTLFTLYLPRVVDF